MAGLRIPERAEKLCRRQKLESDTTAASYSPGVKGSAGEQGAVVVVTDEVGHRCGAIACGGLADCTDIDFVLGVPNVQQENVIHQHRVRRNHTTFQRNAHH